MSSNIFVCYLHTDCCCCCCCHPCAVMIKFDGGEEGYAEPVEPWRGRHTRRSMHDQRRKTMSLCLFQIVLLFDKTTQLYTYIRLMPAHCTYLCSFNTCCHPRATLSDKVTLILASIITFEIKHSEWDEIRCYAASQEYLMRQSAAQSNPSCIDCSADSQAASTTRCNFHLPPSLPTCRFLHKT